VAATPSIRDLEALRQFTSPTLANALELLGIDRADVPFMSPAIRCFFPEFGLGDGRPGSVQALEKGH
jgi:hypothetical protein